MKNSKDLLAANASVMDTGKLQAIFNVLLSIFDDKRIDERIRLEYVNRILAINKDSGYK